MNVVVEGGFTADSELSVKNPEPKSTSLTEFHSANWFGKRFYFPFQPTF